MSQPIGIGVIGMGWMGQVHSRAYRQIPDRYHDTGLQPRLVVCADDVEARAKQAQEMFGFEKYTTDWHEVLANPDVQVVNIASPNNLHLEMVRAAAAAGKHIFCEKPIGRSPQETAEVEWLARQAGVLSFVGYNYRWAPMVQYTRQLIAEGKLGSLTHYRGRFFSMYGSSPLGQLTWRFDEKRAGLGTLGDLMSHVIDMASMLAGRITRVVGNRHTFIPERPLPIPGKGTAFSVGGADDPKGPVTNEDYAGALVQFESGAQGTFEACRAIFGPKCEMAFQVNGTQGAAGWNFETLNELDLYLPQADGGHEGYTRLLGGPRYPGHGRFYPGDGLGVAYDDLKAIEAYQFLNSVAQGKQAQPGFAEALAVANVQAAWQRSWASNAWEDVTSLRRD